MFLYDSNLMNIIINYINHLNPSGQNRNLLAVHTMWYYKVRKFIKRSRFDTKQKHRYVQTQFCTILHIRV